MLADSFRWRKHNKNKARVVGVGFTSSQICIAWQLGRKVPACRVSPKPGHRSRYLSAYARLDIGPVGRTRGT